MREVRPKFTLNHQIFLGLWSFFFLVIGMFGSANATEKPTLGPAVGHVEIPLEVYNRLVEQSRTPVSIPRSAPSTYTLGNARVSVQVQGEQNLVAEVRIQLQIEIFENDWSLIPLLPTGTPMVSTTVAGAPVQLLPTPDGLAWSSRQKGIHQMELVYRLDALHSADGFSLPVSLPKTAGTTLQARLPGAALNAAVIPATGVRSTTSQGVTQITATLPMTSGVQITWQPPTRSGHALSRALYRGQLSGEAVRWDCELTVELWNNAAVTLPLLRRSVTLRELAVDGKTAPILLQEDHFATTLRGTGRHTVRLSFEVPIEHKNGPPKVHFDIPQVPVSQFELTLPGRKEVLVQPASNVALRNEKQTTIASFHVPLTPRISFTWTEAIPEEAQAETRANASLYHAIHGEEGVLNIHALVDYEVTRGETHVLQLQVPRTVQVNRVISPSGAVIDWRLEDENKEFRHLTAFLDRKLKGKLLLEVWYDRSLQTSSLPTSSLQTSNDNTVEIEIPLLKTLGTQRQRGMATLLQSQDLALEPTSEENITRVGENQLPPFVREQIDLTVAHTYKYMEASPRLTVKAVPPPRQEGRFDAQIDTLISLGDVTLKGLASVELNIKSGSLLDLQLSLPEGVSLLNLSGPSVRQHKITGAEDKQQIELEFTQEMTGQLRLEVAYELLLNDQETEIEVPTLSIPTAEVGQGRVAVEALSAVEVQPSAVENLTSLDSNALPQQLVLRTTNPILMAYKYVANPHLLELTVRRHEVLEVQEAAIDRAVYRTLFTTDGLAVTTARFMVRNSRQQFLRVQLPEESEIWSAFVDGHPEKPARTQDEQGRDSHLIKIVHSTEGFPVELIYQTPIPAIRGLGTLKALLPRPEILVTHSRWDVFLPTDVRYGRPRSSMSLVAAGGTVESADVAAEMLPSADSRMIEPLRLVVPTAGIHFAFEKLYANQSESGEIGFEIPYASGLGALIAQALSLAGTLGFWLGLVLLIRGPRPQGAGLAIGGLLVIALLKSRYQISLTPAIGISFFLVLSSFLYWLWQWRQTRQEELGEAGHR